MKRITAKEKKQEPDDAPVPDFYAISREFPLEELPGLRLPVPEKNDQKMGISQPGMNPENQMGALDRRRQEILQTISLLQGQPMQAGAGNPLAMFQGQSAFPGNLMAAFGGQPMQQQQSQQQQLQPQNAAPQFANFGGGNLSQLLAANPGVAAALPPQLAEMLKQQQPQGQPSAPAQAPSQPVQPQMQAPAPNFGGFNISQLLSNPASISNLLSQLQGQNQGGQPQQQFQQQQFMGGQQPPQAPSPAPQPNGNDPAALQKKLMEAASSGAPINSETLALLQAQLGGSVGSGGMSASDVKRQLMAGAQANNVLASQAPPPASPKPQQPSESPAPNQNQQGPPGDLLAQLQRQLMGGQGAPQAAPQQASNNPLADLQRQLASNPQFAGLGGLQNVMNLLGAQGGNAPQGNSS